MPTNPFAGFQLPSAGGPSNLSRQGLLSNYNANWQASRNANQDLYNRTVSGFDSVLGQQRGDLAGISNEYRQRQRAVVGGLAGANQANETDIGNRFSQLLGGSIQGLMDRGLGNSTITSSVERGVGQSYADALTRSRNDFATSIANMRSQWGMAALAQKQQAALANSGLASQQAQSLMQNTNVGYPDMGPYASMIASDRGSQNLDALLGAGGAGGPGMLQFDPSRPVGGPGPHSPAFYAPGGQESGPSYPGAPGLPQQAAPPQYFNGWAGSAGSGFGQGIVMNTAAGGASGAMGGGGGYGASEARGGPAPGYAAGWDQSAEPAFDPFSFLPNFS